MDVYQSIVLGVVQGLTEFLPVSSSGHLVLANYFLGWGDALPAVVTFATNTGTLLAVAIYLRRDVVVAVAGFVSGLRSAEARRGDGWRMAMLVLVGSAPTVLIGLTLRPLFASLNAPLPVALGLIATGVMLWTAPSSGPKATVRDLSFRDVLVTGVAQGLAIIPGISRSGATITALLWRGGSSDLAPRVSFLMYLLVSAGVAVLTLDEIVGAEFTWPALIGMTVASFAVGYAALIALFAVLRRGRFRVFAPYLWVAAGVTLVRLAIG
ncbi:MAG: undecaprenyl-diphosphate phosphatase [bacterium]|nr:undecaprenyl-diphosphate phosphatase [bacterium]